MNTKMNNMVTLLIFLCAFGPNTSFGGEPIPPYGYVCPPCYHVNDLFETESYEHGGECPICGMSLIERRTLLDADTINLHPGSGNFLLRNGIAHPDKPVFVFYHMPTGFNVESPILLVIPGAGRNGWSYRDAWIEAAEEYNVLVLAPFYPDGQYDFSAYHMGGVITDFKLENVKLEPDGSAPSRYYLNDEDILSKPNNDSGDWIFSDFDLIFRQAVAATGSKQESYDIFGHSAGGQILHRMTIFHPGSNAGRIVAANSGLYTLPDHKVSLPFGLGGSNISAESLKISFSNDLILLIGEEDDANETRGTMLHTPLVDERGLGRLSRGKFFYRKSRDAAESMGADFNWRIQTVEGVGHDQREMGKAAAEYLYGSSE